MIKRSVFFLQTSHTYVAPRILGHYSIIIVWMSVRRRHKLLAIVLLLFFVGIGIRYFLWSIRLLDMNGGNHLQHSTDDVLARLARGDVAELEGLASLDLTNRGLTTFPMQVPPKWIAKGSTYIFYFKDIGP